MAKKPDPHDQTEKQLKKFPVDPNLFAKLLKTHLINFIEISPAWVPTRTRLRLIEASRQTAPADSAPRAVISKPAGYNKAIEKMLSAYVAPQDPESIVDHLQAAIYFFENWGRKHPEAQMTGLMQFAACKLLLAAERHIGALHYHETREGKRVEAIRTGQAHTNKEENTKTALDIFTTLSAENKKSKAKAAKEIADRWPKKWRDKSAPSQNTIEGYIDSAWRRSKTDKR